MKEDHPSDSLRPMEEDMRKMLGDDRFCDMAFLCGDNTEVVPALRMLVAARSPVLESMLLTANMAESKLTRVPLPEMEASIMRICLEFFYTDTVQPSSYHDAMSLMKVIFAARFFLVEKLESLASQQGIFAMVEGRKFDALDTAKAFTYGVSLQHACASNHLHLLLLDLLHYNMYRWDFDCYKHLSDGAVFYLVQHSCRPSGCHLYWEPFPSMVFFEYDRLYHVIMWCSVQIVLNSQDPVNEQTVAVATITRFLPNQPYDLYKHLLDTSASDEILVDASTSRFLKLLAEQLSTWLKKFPINLSAIPLVVLYKMIEPLDIIPCSMLLAAYRCQAAEALTRENLRWDKSGCDRFYTVSEEDATVITASQTFSEALQDAVWLSTSSDLSISSGRWSF